jgi:hypothetical protein
MKSAISSKLMLSVCALVGGVLLSSASAKPFKLFSHDRDHDRDDDDDEASVPKVYIVTDEPLKPGSTGIVRVVPAPEAVPGATGTVRIVPAPETAARKTQKGETRYLERVNSAAAVPETGHREGFVPPKALPVEDTEIHERVTTTEERPHTPVKTARRSSTQTSSRKVHQPKRGDEEEAEAKVATSRPKDSDMPATRKLDSEEEVKTRVSTTKENERDLPPTRKHDEEEEVKTQVSTARETERVGAPDIAKHEAVEESTTAPVVRSNNPLMPNPAATEERKPLVPSDIPAPQQETTVTKEVTTSRTSPTVKETPPEPPVEEQASSSPVPDVPQLTAPRDYASPASSPRGRSGSAIAPANLPPGSIDKAGAKHSSADIPVAEKTEKPGFVKTPFTPSKLIDVRGMASGSLAKDPSTSQVFRVP